MVTSDNPRTEDPQSILDMIVPAVPQPFFVDVDRRTAIAAAVAEATPADVVLIAGKGHEDYQILGTNKIHFDDREEAAAAAANRARFTADELCEATGGRLHGDMQPLQRVIIDGRKAAPGDLYVAIRGDTLDGHEFTEQAIERGASGVVVSDGKPRAVATLMVEDTRLALGRIARAHRRKWGKRGVVALTGSTGKTTTKSLMRAALGRRLRVHAPQGSLNNETGVPLTLLGLRDFHDVAVLEMGMRGLGQIDYLCEIAEPDVGVLLNVGTAHLGELGSTDNILAAKTEIFRRLPDHGCAVFSCDDPRIPPHAGHLRRRVTFGESAGSDVRLIAYEANDAGSADAEYRVGGRDVAVRLPLVGRHNAINAACALATALALGIDLEDALLGVAQARSEAMRGEIVTVAGRQLFLDCYNANPASMAAALDTVAALAGSRSAIAVLGDMLELGDAATELHRQVAQHARRLGMGVIALGTHASELAGDTGTVADDPAHAARLALEQTEAGDWILLKASRGMKLERVLAELSRATGEE